MTKGNRLNPGDNHMTIAEWNKHVAKIDKLKSSKRKQQAMTELMRKVDDDFECNKYQET